MKKTIKILKKKLKNYNPKLREECGVFGISNSDDAAALTALGLHALQHRGQEGCGIVSFDGKKYHSEKRFGLVGDNFNKEKVLKNLLGKYAIGQTSPQASRRRQRCRPAESCCARRYRRGRSQANSCPD